MTQPRRKHFLPGQRVLCVRPPTLNGTPHRHPALRIGSAGVVEGAGPRLDTVLVKWDAAPPGLLMHLDPHDPATPGPTLYVDKACIERDPNDVDFHDPDDYADWLLRP